MGEKVSIIIPVFNRETLVGETLDSILAQTYFLWECILVDDGSTDKTITVLEEYQAKDQRIKVFQRPSHLPKGAPSCRNFGFDQATGDFIQYFDSDDLMLPEMLAEKVQYLNEHPEAAFVVSKMGEFDENGIRNAKTYSISSQNVLHDFLNYKVFFLTPGPLFRKRFLDKFDVKFDTTLKRNQEREFYTRVILEKPAFGTIENIHCLRRMHTGSIKSIFATSDDLLKLRYRYQFYAKVDDNSGGKHAAVLLKEYGSIIFQTSLSLISRRDITTGVRALLLYFSLCTRSLFSKPTKYQHPL